MTDKKKLLKQVNTNTRRIRKLMRDVRLDIARRTRASRDLDEWYRKMSPYLEEDFLTVGIHSDNISLFVKGVVKAVEMSKLPSGMNAGLTKGVISECCYTYISNMSRDMQTELQKIAVESYNQKRSPQELARILSERVDVMDTTRARCIARTETIRASNLSNLIQAKGNGAKSYTIRCDVGVCNECFEIYKDGDEVFDIDDTENFPPYHPNCRCTPRFSTKSVDELT